MRRIVEVAGDEWGCNCAYHNYRHHYPGNGCVVLPAEQVRPQGNAQWDCSSVSQSVDGDEEI